jgi:formate-dependent nitrite reductase membrane component NrfD
MLFGEEQNDKQKSTLTIKSSIILQKEIKMIKEKDLIIGIVGTIIGVGGYTTSVISLPFTIPLLIPQYGFIRASIIGMGITLIGVILVIVTLCFILKLTKCGVVNGG